jgi:acetylornithine deacetylase/succinyl-diaminopimelate desuccinylase-like protein
VSMNPSGPLKYARAHRPRFVRELKDFIRFPSVSAQPKHASDVRNCGTWLARHLRKIGMPQVRVFPTRGHPIVYAEWKGAATCPTVLIYGHYDVQPADPLGKWHSPPFTPVVRGDHLYGRGACDDKGQMFAHLKALEAFLRTRGKLPVNVKCVFDGEEEIGSPALRRFLVRNRVPLAADVAVVSDMPIPGPNRPAITYALRGGLSLELEVTGPQRDLHSGLFGGAIHNPLQALCEIVARLHDDAGGVAIPGFYDRVRAWSGEEREYMRRAGPPDDQLLRDARAEQPWGEPGYSLYERTTIRPALTVNGLSGGYQGPGGKGVIPARALAKLSFRLVPDQDPREIERLVRRQVERICPPTVKARLRTLSHSNFALVDRSHPSLQAAMLAYKRGFGKAPRFLRCGGTIPIVNTIHEELGIPTVLMGFALPDDRIHGPDEKFYLPNLFRGIATSVWFLYAVGARNPRDAEGRLEGRFAHDY